MGALFKKSSGEVPSGDGNPKQKQQVLLLLLLLLLGAFAYLYYFTGLIKPRAQAPSPPVQNEQVKQAIPPRAPQPTPSSQATGEKAPGAPEQKAGPAAPTAQPKTANKPGEAVPQATANRPQTAPQQQPAAKTAAAKPESSKPGGKPEPPKVPVKPEPAKPAAKPEAVKPVMKEKGQVASSVAASKNDTKKITAAHATEEDRHAKKTAEKARVYSLIIKAIPDKHEVAALKSGLAKAGAKSVKVHNVQRLEPMNRLFVSEFGDRAEAEVEVQKVRKMNSDAFILKDGQTYGVYAGSYLSPQRAMKEKAQLSAKGFKVSIRKTKVTVPVLEVTAGFGTRGAAEKEAAKLGKKGLSVKVVTSKK